MQNHQADSPLYVCPDVWSVDLHLFIQNMVIHDTKCPYWDQVSLNNTKQTPSATLYECQISIKCTIQSQIVKPGQILYLIKYTKVQIFSSHWARLADEKGQIQKPLACGA